MSPALNGSSPASNMMNVVGLAAIDGKLLIIYISQTKHTSEKNGVIGEVDLPAGLGRECANEKKKNRCLRNLFRPCTTQTRLRCTKM